MPKKAPDTYGFAEPGNDGGATYSVVTDRAATSAAKAYTDTLDRRTRQVKAATVAQTAYSKQVDAATKRTRELAASLRDGSYARHAGQMAVINREYARLQQTAKVTSLVAEHGRLGAAVRLNRAEYQTLGRAALYGVGGIAAMGFSLARAGLAGTVEGYRLEYAWTRLGRQVAGVAVPAVEKVSGAVGWAARQFETMNKRQQDNVLTFGLLAAGAVAAAGAIRTVATIGGAAVAVVGGMRAAMGVGAGAAAAGGLAAGGAAGAAGGGAAAGVAGGAAAGAAGRGLLARGAGFAAKRLIPAAAVGYAAHEAATGGYYSDARGRGKNKFTAGASAVAGGIADTMTFGYYGRSQEEKRSGAAADKARSQVTPLQVATDEIGGAFQRIQEEVLKVTSADNQKYAGTPPEMVESIKKIEAMFEKAVGDMDATAMRDIVGGGSLGGMLRRGG